MKGKLKEIEYWASHYENWKASEGVRKDPGSAHARAAVERKIF
jgi:hypothetical protein